VSKRHEEVAQVQVMADHLKELRIRLLVCIVIAVAGGVVGYIFYQPILNWLRSPLHADLYYNTPAGSFTFIMKVVSMVGIGIALPALVYNLLMFVQPALKRRFSGFRITTFTLFSIVLAAGGAAFAFYAILPGALHFFGGFQVTGLSALISADSYLSFVTNALITFMIVFQIPLLMIIFDRIKPIPPKKLFALEKYVVLAGFLIAMVVPFAFDLVTCLLIAAPIIVLYNLSVGMIILQHLQRRYLAKRRGLRVDDEQQLDDDLIAEFLAEQKEAVHTPVPQPTPILEAFAAMQQTVKETPKVSAPLTKPASKVIDPQFSAVKRPTVIVSPKLSIEPASQISPDRKSPVPVVPVAPRTVMTRPRPVARPVTTAAASRYVTQPRPIPTFKRPRMVSAPAPLSPSMTVSMQSSARLITGIQ